MKLSLESPNTRYRKNDFINIKYFMSLLDKPGLKYNHKNLNMNLNILPQRYL